MNEADRTQWLTALKEGRYKTSLLAMIWGTEMPEELTDEQRRLARKVDEKDKQLHILNRNIVDLENLRTSLQYEKKELERQLRAQLPNLWEKPRPQISSEE